MAPVTFCLLTVGQDFVKALLVDIQATFVAVLGATLSISPSLYHGDYERSELQL